MDKTMDLSEKMSMENNVENQESNEEMFVRKVKMDKYGTLPPTHTFSSREVMMSSGKQNVGELLDNSEANCSSNAIPLLKESDISAAEATRSNKISLFDNGKVAPTDEMLNECNECGKRFKEISSLHGHKGVHRREEYKSKRKMLEQQPNAVDASHLVSAPKPRETRKDEMIIHLAARALLSMEFKRLRPDDLSASRLTCPNKHISADEETDDEMREDAEILVTLAQSFCMDSTVHVSSSASPAKCFVCTTCNKVFSSYNALGGHMSIHNNKPTKKSLLKEGGAGSSGGDREQSTWKYVCDKCNKKFPTGQILGGHKRGHWWEDYYKMAQQDRNVKPSSPILPHHETERSGLVVVPTDENIQPAGTGLVVAAHTVPLACDGVHQPQQVMSLGNEIEMPVPSSVSDKDIA